MLMYLNCRSTKQGFSILRLLRCGPKNTSLPRRHLQLSQGNLVQPSNYPARQLGRGVRKHLPSQLSISSREQVSRESSRVDSVLYGKPSISLLAPPRPDLIHRSASEHGNEEKTFPKYLLSRDDRSSAQTAASSQFSLIPILSSCLDLTNKT
ncbi:hypothetical protein T440DRAFT_273118 [Plenodomus tracheiphilus IPT5]|uniref:Uncharacterized protein n=1 Tax=Plenodomus tracheiphilus IPT5 TaxID=1408161 RepID=A0A6A7BG43_9PLEO|nr:hypothetical protein T440DRAFT_273118 [Plenodomus tracheiphilus IPT5]